MPFKDRVVRLARQREASRRWRARHPERRRDVAARSRRKAYSNPNKRSAMLARHIDWYNRNLERERAKNRERNKRLREEALLAYGGKCTCCGETELAFLTLDHINGGGTKHRNSGFQGTKLYWHLKHAKYPSGYQVLCANCNMAKARSLGCPHRHKEAA
jgi:hypothetical protein